MLSLKKKLQTKAKSNLNSKPLNSAGFGHIELALLVIVIFGIASVGYYVYKHDRPNANVYTALTAFTANGISFNEKACIASQVGSAPNYTDTVTAVVSVGQQAGPKTVVMSKGQVVPNTGYNPVAYYSIGGSAPITEDNWVTSSTSTVQFNLVPTSSSATFSLGVQSITDVSTPFSGSSQTIGSLTLCNPPIKSAVVAPEEQTGTPVIKTTTNGTTTVTTTTVANPVTQKTTTIVTTTNSATQTTTTTSTTVPTPVSSTTSTGTSSTSPGTPSKPTSPTSPTSPSKPAPAPTISLTASPTSLTAGSKTTLTWKTTNVTSCTASGAWSGSQPTSGSTTSAALSSTVSYSLSCSGTGGSTIATVIVSVTNPSPVPVPVPTPAPKTGVITAGNSKANCIEFDAVNGMINDSQVAAVTAITGVTYNCVLVYNQPMPTWADWDTPWAFNSYYNWGAWIAESSSHQVVFGEDLIPQSIQNNNDPLTWEQQCDAGDFNSYATALGKDLVAGGGGSVIIRLGIEANGTWETDFVGTTTQEQNAWAQCYDQEVTAMRAVPGSHFLFVWNPNICTENIPLNEWYPGNAYVDIIGADAYDEDCWTQQSVSEEGWSAFANDTSANSPNNSEFPSLNNIVSFAAANGKPFALPEWGESTSLPDDPTYVTDMGNVVKDNDTSFQAWFDDGSQGTRVLGSDIPLSTAAYKTDFGD